MFDTKSIERIKEILVARKETLAAAESVTAGFLQAALASAVDASQFFQGGISVYNLGQKCRHLDIDPIHALSCNSVSTTIAKDMSRMVCKRFLSDWGIGITGYASPVPESANTIFAFYAIAYHGEIKTFGQLETDKRDAVKVQLYYVDMLIKAMAAIIEKGD